MEKLVKISTCILALLSAVLVINAITAKKFETLRQGNVYYSKDVVTTKTRERQLDCLAMNIYREAGHEPFEGKVAVAQVTMNRVDHPSFPKDVCGVIYQKTSFMDRVVCQFSWYCDSATKTRPINKAAYDESYAVAKKVLLENFKLDVLKQALYYHADYVNPQWKLEKIGKIGQHIFYKPKES